ncbi:MAG: hypothetical protein Q7U28_07995 [Aquabacterium sp.]|nr:hypothetical protein [Aquabacterium sp.]
MDRAFSSGSSASPPTAPASPSIGYATAGNPGAGTPATKPGAYWYHMMTEEIRGVLVAAGLTPSQSDVTQLLQALRAAGVFQTQATNDATTKVATTAFVNPGSSIASTGYLKLPSGLIIQWGSSASISSGANLAVTLPIAFPNNIFNFYTLLQQGTDLAAGGAYVGQNRASSLSSITIRNLGPAAAQYSYLAFGN